jgi:hypothetical protein
MCERLWSELEGGDGSTSIAIELLPYCGGIFTTTCSSTATSSSAYTSGNTVAAATVGDVNGRIAWEEFADRVWSLGCCIRDDAVFERALNAES